MTQTFVIQVCHTFRATLSYLVGLFYLENDIVLICDHTHAFEGNVLVVAGCHGRV